MFTVILVMAFPFLFHSYEVSLEYVVKSLLFIPYYHNGIPGPVMELGWTLNYEMFFYLIFYFTSVISFENRGIITCVVLVSYSVLGKVVNLPLVLKYWSDPIIIEFCFGILSYILWKLSLGKIVKRINRNWFNSMCIVLFLIAIFFMDYLMNVNSGLRGITVGLIAFAVVSLLAIFDKQLYKIRLFSRIGKDSYQLYLLHPFFVRGVDIIIGKFMHFSLITSFINLFVSTFLIEVLLVLWKKSFEHFKLIKMKTQS